MGSEDLFHKRKAKRKEDFTRQKASRNPYEKVLIVCEGTNTEPKYFREIKDHYEINSANISISGKCGTDPLSVFNHGFELYLEQKYKGDAYDRVYCVFDQDSYNLGANTYQKALNKISSFRPKETFFAINSVPCFEYWFILHFNNTTAPFSAKGKLSIGETVFNDLKALWPVYTKSMDNSFSLLLPRLEFAKRNSIRSLLEADRHHTDNPTTHVHELVTYLQNIKNT